VRNRQIAAPDARSRASVAGAGWPNGLAAPALTTATAGRSASSAADEAPALPWCATFSTVNGAGAAASRPAGGRAARARLVDGLPPDALARGAVANWNTVRRGDTDRG